MSSPTSPILTLMIEAAEHSAQIIRKNFRHVSQIQNKTSHQDIVTNTDVQSQQVIHDHLLQGMKKLGYDEAIIGFVEEESTGDSVKTHTFIVDPLDGTTNFAAGIPFSGISIAYAEQKEIKLGVIFEPYSETLYWGEKGQGSYVKSELFGEHALLFSPKPMTSWLVAAHFNSSEIAQKQFSIYQKIYPHIRGLRNIGALVLDCGLLADGVLDAIFVHGCCLWDLAAAQVILPEAGYGLYTLQGEKLKLEWDNTKYKYEVMACSPNDLDQIMNILNT